MLFNRSCNMRVRETHTYRNRERKGERKRNINIKRTLRIWVDSFLAQSEWERKKERKVRVGESFGKCLILSGDYKYQFVTKPYHQNERNTVYIRYFRRFSTPMGDEKSWPLHWQTFWQHLIKHRLPQDKTKLNSHSLQYVPFRGSELSCNHLELIFWLV